VYPLALYDHKEIEKVFNIVEQGEKTGIIFNIQKFSVHDGPGIRTTVFMKGCPLHCYWCSNAESINPKPELGVIRERCNNCGKCLKACPEEAISFDDNVIRFNRDRCTACGECVAVCFPGALTIYGRQVTVGDVFKEVSRDKSFYEGSSGGVTVSGGEPLRQADFVIALFEECREAGIHTCLDTSGYAASDVLKQVLRVTDYVLFDIKHMNLETHRRVTGQPNTLILKNGRMVAPSGAEMLCRIPLIAGVNDTVPNITETARFVKSLGDGIQVELLPYHRLGVAKYQTLDKHYPGEDYTTPLPEQVKAVKQIFEQLNVKCNIGG